LKGLIIRSPYIDWILSGEKIWEMRSRRTSYRGQIGLIKKGTGMIVGVTNLIDCLPPLSDKCFAATRNKHAIPEQMDAAVLEAGWVYPWVFEGSRRLKQPVEAKQKKGQVTWVYLEDGIVAAISVYVSS
jgi:hypothetical protein